MGTWGAGPFDSDAAVDFLGDAASSPARVVSRTLRDIARAPAGTYLDVDDGYAGWAAAELVALAFGRGGSTTPRGKRLRELAAKIPAWEEYRALAVDALARIADPATSELASLWHDGKDPAAGAGFEAAVAELRARLESLGIQ